MFCTYLLMLNFCKNLLSEITQFCSRFGKKLSKKKKIWDLDNFKPNSTQICVISGKDWISIIIFQASVGCEEGIERARVVYLAPPADPLSPVVSGTAVIDTGEFLGQRVEFDRSVCSAYSFSLAKADLSHIIQRGWSNYIFSRNKYDM